MGDSPGLMDKKCMIMGYVVRGQLLGAGSLLICVLGIPLGPQSCIIGAFAC